MTLKVELSPFFPEGFCFRFVIKATQARQMRALTTSWGIAGWTAHKSPAK